MQHLAEMRASLDEKVKALETILAKDTPTEDDTKAFSDLTAEIEKLEKAIETREKAEKTTARFAKPADGSDPKTVPAEAKTEPEKFSSLGEQLQAISSDGMNKGDMSARDRRLVYKAPTGANEGTPSEGGFLVQTDYSLDLLNSMHEMGDVIGRCWRVPISGPSNGLLLPTIDETSRANGSRFGGVSAYWANEAETAGGGKPKFGNIELKLKKLLATSYATEELLADTSALEAIFKRAFTEELMFKTEDGVFNGSGSGQMLGFMNSSALITVPKESGQAAGTIVAQNILNMTARLSARSMRNAVWYINQDILPQLWNLTIGSGTATHLMFAPPGLTNDNKNAPYGTLMGRPVYPVEYSATLGTTGDIVLVDLSNYITIDKGGMDWSESMHVRFLYDEMTFKITYRLDGQPAWKKPLTPANGSSTVSPFIALETRG